MDFKKFMHKVCTYSDMLYLYIIRQGSGNYSRLSNYQKCSEMRDLATIFGLFLCSKVIYTFHFWLFQGDKKLFFYSYASTNRFVLMNQMKDADETKVSYGPINENFRKIIQKKSPECGNTRDFPTVKP